MGYLGKQPSAVPLTSDDITDNIITSSKIVDGAITGDDINSTFNIGSKTVTLPAASVTAHASDYIDWQSVVTASTLTAVAGKGYPINTTSNACTVTLPASASVGDTIKFVDYARNWGTNAVTINQNSLNFQGYTSPNPVYNTNGQSVTLTYVDVTKGWLPTVDDDVTDEVPQVHTVEWLVIAGGGTGSTGYRSGGGGAGGYRNSYASETSGGGGASETAWTFPEGSGTVITVTVGAGGNNPTTQQIDGTNGGNSSIAASGQTTVTSTGGGGGGHHHSSAGDPQSGTWGSGGGRGHKDAIVADPNNGTTNQGYSGGGIENYTGSSPHYYVGGGGGGSGSIGVKGGAANVYSGDGGQPTSSSITGTAVKRAGGGGAGGYYSSTTYADEGRGGGTTVTADKGGAGDGGTDHTSPLQDGENASAASDGYNSGSGGGGSGGNTTAGTGDGDDGIVILRVPTSEYSSTTSGSPTVLTDGAYKVLVFQSSGSYTLSS